MPGNIRAMTLDQGIVATMNAVRAGNRYIEQRAPWALAKQGETALLNTVLFTCAEELRRIAILLEPVMPEKMAELRNALGYTGAEASARISDLRTEAGPAGRMMHDLAGLFPRIVVEKPESAPAEPKKKEKPVNTGYLKNLIDRNAFFKRLNYGLSQLVYGKFHENYL